MASQNELTAEGCHSWQPVNEFFHKAKSGQHVALSTTNSECMYSSLVMYLNHVKSIVKKVMYLLITRELNIRNLTEEIEINVLHS